jgi:hypothetical protein
MTVAVRVVVLRLLLLLRHETESVRVRTVRQEL